MKLHEKVAIGGIFAAIGGVAVHIISDLFFTSNKAGMALLVIGLCGIGAGQMLQGVSK